VTIENKICMVCDQSSQEIPLLAIEYQEQKFWICPQHFPILIHQPQRLVGKLPGAEKLQDGHEH
jgi:hypothetical protein